MLSENFLIPVKRCRMGGSFVPVAFIKPFLIKVFSIYKVNLLQWYTLTREQPPHFLWLRQSARLRAIAYSCIFEGLLDAMKHMKAGRSLHTLGIPYKHRMERKNTGWQADVDLIFFEGFGYLIF